MKLGERIEKILGIDPAPGRAARTTEPTALDVDGIDVGPGHRLHRYSVGHARSIEDRIQFIREVAMEDGNRPLTFDEHARVTALEDVLLRGVYLLREAEQVDAVSVDGVIATEDELRAFVEDQTPVEPYETAALRGAAALGRILSAEEIAAWEQGEATRPKVRRHNA